MRILQVVPSYLPATRYGGPIRTVHGLCQALVERGHEVHVFTTDVDGPMNSPVPLGVPVAREGVRVWYFPVSWGRRLYYAPAMERRLVQDLPGFDCLHLHSVFLWPTWAAARTARRAGIPYVLSPLGMLEAPLLRGRGFWRKRAWIALIERRNLAAASAIHLKSQREARELAALGLDLAPLVILPNGVRVPTRDDIREPAWLPKIHRPFVLSLGRINWKKGLDRLIRAMADVPDGTLVVAGNDEEGDQPRLAALARSLGIADRVRFVGPVDDREKWALYREAALFALPSLGENFGVVVLEAMAMGCPVVVTASVGTSEIVDRVQGGLVIPDAGKTADEIVRDLSRAIHRLLREPNRRIRLGEKGKQAVQTDYSWSGIARAMTDTYQRIAADGCRG